MTTENQQLNPSKTSSTLTDVNSLPKMEGWFKLKEKILKSGPSINKSNRSILNRNLTNNKNNNYIPLRSTISYEIPSTNSTNTNGHRLISSEPINTLDSPPNIFSSPSIVSITSTPIQQIEDIPSIEIEPPVTPRLRRESVPAADMDSNTATASSSPASTVSKQSENHSKKSPVRKSVGSREVVNTIKPSGISTPMTEDISDDDQPLVDIRKHKPKSIDALSIPSRNDTIIPLATDLQSLPGHSQDETRDIRFIVYNDIDTLTNHLSTCLYVNQRCLFPSEQDISKPCSNVLHKIFRLYYIKTLLRNLSLEKKSFFNKKDNQQKQQPLSMISSPTSTAFKIDWNVNRRHSSSTHRHTPKNFFHVLQLNPQTTLSFSNQNESIQSISPKQTLERIKDILARTYYPHLYAAIEYGYQFGEKAIFSNTQQLVSTHQDVISIKQRPESPDLLEDSLTITLKSPPSSSTTNKTPQTPLSPIIKKSKSKDDNRTSSTISIENSIHDDDDDQLSSLGIKKSIVVLTPTKIPISSSSSPSIEQDKKLNNNNNRKRKSSSTITTNVIENKKKRVISSPSIETINHIEDITDPESEEETLPSELPTPCVIKNGLRSNYYKTSNDNQPKSNNVKTRLERRRRQSSGSLPSFYTGIFESDDDKSTHIDYCLPYDIYWFSQQQQQQQVKQPTTNNSPSTSTTFQHKKKKSTQPKQKQPLVYKKITRNFYSDQLKQTLLSNYSSEKAPVCDCKSPSACEDGICLNKLVYTECLPACTCGAKCGNQKIRKSQWFKNLEVFDTGKYGLGLRTTASIPKGTFLCEYVGEVITDEKFHERMTNLYSKDEHHYTMKLTQNLVIDAYRMGSIARFANHSCLPNCEFQKWTVDGLQRMCMFSLRPIKPGEELTYDYNFQCFNLQAQQPCYCDSSKCRGTIGARQPTNTTTNNNNNGNNHNHHSPPTTIQRLTQREKRMVLQSSIFLLRNLQKVKEKQELKKKKTENYKQSTDKQSAIPLFFPQNYYHSNGTNSKSTLPNLRKTPKLTHKDLFYLFYNHIRRSHFYKTGRYQSELIDETCSYAQIAQLTLILNEIFDLILYYKSINTHLPPSDVLKKCPLKRLFPAYYQIITKPIDLIMIRNKLDNGEYITYNLFEQDLFLLFNNAITYCGPDSDDTRAVLELQDYYLRTIKIEYKTKLNLFENLKHDNLSLPNIQILENFSKSFHEKEIRDGQIREILYEIICNIDPPSDDDSPIVYKIVLANNTNSHRPTRTKTSNDYIVHCRCGSVYDENSLVQCYACQLWQHIACVSINDPTRPYYCFECQPTCELNPLNCLKTNVLINSTLAPLQIHDDNHCSFSTLTRSDGFVIRVNECYFVSKQDRKNIDWSLTSPEYDIFCVERLWFDEYGNGQSSGFYYIRPNETYHEPNRKFFPNEVFRFPSSNDPVHVDLIVRPCFVLDIRTYFKGKPISDNSSRVLSNDLFICEYRVDKSARTFTRLTRTRLHGINTKSYCFDNYVEKPSIKRDYQPYQKEIRQQQQQHENRRRPSSANTNKLNNKKFQEKTTRIKGCIEKIYCRYHDKNAIPKDKNSIFTNNHHQQHSPVKDKPAGNISRKRRTISLSSDDDIVELVSDNDTPRLPKRRATKQN